MSPMSARMETSVRAAAETAKAAAAVVAAFLWQPCN